MLFFLLMLWLWILHKASQGRSIYKMSLTLCRNAKYTQKCLNFPTSMCCVRLFICTTFVLLYTPQEWFLSITKNTDQCNLHYNDLFCLVCRRGYTAYNSVFVSSVVIIICLVNYMICMAERYSLIIGSADDIFKRKLATYV